VNGSDEHQLRVSAYHPNDADLFICVFYLDVLSCPSLVNFLSSLRSFVNFHECFINVHWLVKVGVLEVSFWRGHCYIDSLLSCVVSESLYTRKKSKIVHHNLSW